MFVPLVYRLRDAGVPVGVTEAVALADALSRGAHQNTFLGFYYTARSILIHHEGHLDAFDQAFAQTFGSVAAQLGEDGALSSQIREWLADARATAGVDDDQEWPTDEQIEHWRQLFAERLADQTERHTGGSHWIGTGGTSPHGQAGQSKAGLSTGSSGGGRSAIHVAQQRAYQGYRSDLVLDVRQFEVALRRLRSFVREGAQSELDMAGTIDATARNAGDIAVVTRPPRRPDTHVLLMVDVGGSMHPYSRLMSQLFSAAKKATHFKDLRTYYFHNCVYGRVYTSEDFTEPVWVHDLVRRYDSRYRLIMIGDALMGDYELHMRGAAAPSMPGMASGLASWGGVRGVSGLEWLRLLRDHFTSSVWLNPEPPAAWRGTTIEQITAVFDMYPMTVEGLTDAMAKLNRGSKRLH